MQLRHMLPAARVELLDPKPQKPSYRLLLQLAVGRVQDALNEASNTHRAWAVDDTTLSVVAGVEEYELDGSIGKVLDVTNVIDQSTENSSEWQVPFYDLSELAGGWAAWGGWNDWGNSGMTRIAFFRRSGLDALYARVRPVPQASFDYRVSFNVGSYAEGMALEDEPFLTAHHSYIVCSIARDALAGTEWTNDRESDAEKRSNLDTSLSRRIDKYYDQFKLNIAGLSAPRMTERAEAFSIE